MHTETFPVQGLNVAGCARAIEKRVSGLLGVARVEASYVTQTVTITYDEIQLDERHVREMVQDCGFACGGALAPIPAPPGPAAGVPAGEHAHGAHMRAGPETAHREIVETLPPTHAMSHDTAHGAGHHAKDADDVADGADGARSDHAM